MSRRIAIIGWPKSGKTTFAASLSNQARSTDSVIGLGWSEASLEVSNWLDEPGPWVIEGVALPRALRKWQQRNPDEPPPIDRMIYLHTQHQQLIDGQTRMGKGMDTVFAEIEDWLVEFIEIEHVY